LFITCGAELVYVQILSSRSREIAFIAQAAQFINSLC
jgi:hypothetical protein